MGVALIPALAALLVAPALGQASGGLAPQAFTAQEKSPVKADGEDPFYGKLYEDGRDAFERGDFEAAAEDFGIASFGCLDNRPRLLMCYMYLAVAHFELKSFDKCKADLDEIRRLDLETQLAAAAPPETLLKRFSEIRGKLQKSPAKPPAV